MAGGFAHRSGVAGGFAHRNGVAGGFAPRRLRRSPQGIYRQMKRGPRMTKALM